MTDPSKEQRHALCHKSVDNDDQKSIDLLSDSDESLLDSKDLTKNVSTFWSLSIITFV